MLKYYAGGTDSSKFTGSITFTYVLFHLLIAILWVLSYIAPSLTPHLQTNSGVSISPSSTARLPFYRPLPVLLTPVRPQPSKGGKRSYTDWQLDNDITGTTLILIATNAFTIYESLTGGVLDNNTGLLKVTSTQFADLETLSFVVGGVCILYYSHSVWKTHIIFFATRFHLDWLPTVKSGLVPLTLTLVVFQEPFTWLSVILVTIVDLDSTLSTARPSSSDSTLYSTLATSVLD